MDYRIKRILILEKDGDQLINAIMVYKRVMAISMISRKGRSAFFMVVGYCFGLPDNNVSVF
jgi:hypothetical protein